ncbi:unnamed protein product [Linum trigynum]|uniref:Uncharacterized protein n=1 Tax=Linum trigynum TaxID=586398 RepID=A0AAV2CWQ0_9ROSI
MATTPPPPPLGGGKLTQLGVDGLARIRRTPTVSSSPNVKGDKEAQQAKNKVKPSVSELSDEFLEEATEKDSMKAEHVSSSGGALAGGGGAGRWLFAETLRLDE